MLEVLVVVLLGQRLGKKAQQRGLNKNYGWLIVPFWLLSEFFGAMVATLAGADTLVVYLAALASAALGAILAFVVIGNMGSGVPVAPLMPQVPYAGQQYAPPGVSQQYAPPAPPVVESLAPQAGFCSECGETVWLTPNGNCTRGHGPECISNRYTPST